PEKRGYQEGGQEAGHGYCTGCGITCQLGKAMGSDRYLPFLPIILKWIQQTLDAHAHERRAVSSFNFPRLPHYFHSFLSGKSFLYVALAGNAVTARTVPLRNVQMASSNLPESIMPPERYRSSPSSTSYAKSSGEFCMTDSNSRA